jgi:hypothetical protein
MTQEQFLEAVAKLCDQYETEHDNAPIYLVTQLALGEEDKAYTWDGEKMSEGAGVLKECLFFRVTHQHGGHK